MKPSEFYRSKFPLEAILPPLSEKEAKQIVRECDYTQEADTIAAKDFPGRRKYKVNKADAAVFYQMGYQAAMERIAQVLEPVQTNQP
jgi:hypothetical protein